MAEDMSDVVREEIIGERWGMIVNAGGSVRLEGIIAEVTKGSVIADASLKMTNAKIWLYDDNQPSIMSKKVYIPGISIVLLYVPEGE